MKQLVISKSVFKSLTPEQQAGLQNIGALIDQMLQSGMADVRQTQPPPAPPKPPAREGAQPPPQQTVGMALDDDQKKLRIGGLAQNEASAMGKNPDPAAEAEAETKKAPNLGGKMKASKELGQEEARGFRGKSPLIDSDRSDELINADEPAGKLSPDAHPGADATSFAEHRIGDLPLFDEEGAESAMQEGNQEDERPGASNPSATKEQLLMAVARALGFGAPVRKSADEDVRTEVREVRKAVEYLIQKLDPVGARAAQIMAPVEKGAPVLRNDATDDKTRLVIKELLGELQKANPRVFGTEGGDMTNVRKALREEGLPALLALAGQLWTGQQF